MDLFADIPSAQTQAAPASAPVQPAQIPPTQSALGVLTVGKNEQPKLFDDIPAAAQAPSKAFSYSVLPISVDEQGHGHFDPNAGVLGSIKSAVTLPGDVATGKVDPQSEEAVQRAAGLAALATPMSPVARMEGGGLPLATRQAEKPVPSSEDLLSAGGNTYDAIRDLGVDYSPDAGAKWAQDAAQKLYMSGRLPLNAPKTHGVLNELIKPQEEGAKLPVASLMALRHFLRDTSQDLQPGVFPPRPTPDAGAASEVIKSLDDFLTNPPKGGVLAGPADIVGPALKEANANYGAGLRSDTITGKVEKAERRANVANSGANIGNTIRSRITDILDNPKLRSGYSEEELAALESINKGTIPVNVSRKVANLLGGGGGLGAAVSGAIGGAAGGSLGGGPGAVIGATAPLVGMGAKALENNLVRKQAEQASNLVRQRSPLYEKTPEEPVETAPTIAQPSITRAGALAALNDQKNAIDYRFPQDAGSKFVFSPEPNASFANKINGLSADDKTKFAAGFMSKLMDSIEGAQDKASVVKSIFSSPAARERIEMGLGKEAARKLEMQLKAQYPSQNET